MKRLILIRHAKSSWGDPELDDLERPLNKRGNRDAPEMGKRLAKRGLKPDLVLCSPAKRAVRTARIITKELGYSKKEIHTDKRIYDANVSDLLNVIHDIDDTFRTVVLFGHNPSFNSLSHYLTNYSVDNIPTCGVFEMELETTTWKKVHKGLGRFISFDFPKKSAK